MIKILDTMSGRKENFVPRKGKKVQMFVCGPTVYDYIHIGNARTFVFFDVVAKYLRHKGYELDYIQNITDIDDKIIQRANETGRDPLEWAREYEEKFLKDAKELDITGVTRYARATDHIEQVVKQVKTLIDKGHAYFIENDPAGSFSADRHSERGRTFNGAGGWYFDLKTFPEYGKLSKRTAQMADDAVSRIDESDKKRNPGDFALWKHPNSAPPPADSGNPNAPIRINGEPAWYDKDLGWGRPGWHIEDTAITEHHFGPQYDLHGGGQDLIFPHHEAEIAQQEAASGKKPFVKYWMHVAFVVSKDQKMSKSLGNFALAHQLLEKYPKEVLRFYLLSGYYRTPLDFSEKILQQIEEEVNRIKIFLNDVSSADGNEDVETQILQFQKQFFEALDNDFNTPNAFAVMFELIRSLNPKLKFISRNSAGIIKTFFNEVDSILGVIPTITTPDNIRKLVEKMDNLRKEKRYEESDKIRKELENQGYILRNPSESFVTQSQTSVISGVEVKNKEK